MKILLVVFLAVAFLLVKPGTAQAFVCTAAAVHAKSQYALDMWKWVNSSASDDAAPAVVQAKVDKLWDGNGDCDTESDVNKLSAASQLDLVRFHFYGDMMTVPFMMGAKNYKAARAHMDDWLQADALVRKGAGDKQMTSDDAAQRGGMMQFSAKLTKLGYPSQYKP